MARQTRAVCFGSLAQRSAVSRATVNRFLDTMPDGEGQWKIFDINLRQNFYTREVLSASMQKCNVLKINDEVLEKYDLKILILTCGVNGSYVFTPGQVYFQETPKVEVADTVGAGDSFTAAFVSAVLKGMPVEDAHRLAVRTSAYVCTQNGAMPMLPAELTNI